MVIYALFLPIYLYLIYIYIYIYIYTLIVVCMHTTDIYLNIFWNNILSTTMWIDLLNVKFSHSYFICGSNVYELNVYLQKLMILTCSCMLVHR